MLNLLFIKNRTLSLLLKTPSLNFSGAFNIKGALLIIEYNFALLIFESFSPEVILTS